MIGDHVQCLEGGSGSRWPATGRDHAPTGGRGLARDHPAAEHDRLGPAGGGALPGAPVMGLAVGTEPGRDTTGDGVGQVEGGTIRQHAGSVLVGLEILAETDLCTTRPACTHPRRPSPPCQDINTDDLRACLVRKPHWDDFSTGELVTGDPGRRTGLPALRETHRRRHLALLPTSLGRPGPHPWTGPQDRPHAALRRMPGHRVDKTPPGTRHQEPHRQAPREDPAPGREAAHHGQPRHLNIGSAHPGEHRRHAPQVPVTRPGGRDLCPSHPAS